MEKIYLDYAATSPTDPEVIKAMEPYFFERFGNASSPHSLGREANKALEDARAVLANFIGAKPEEIIFSSGATEANNHAILGLCEEWKDKGKHIIVSPIEHHSVFEPIEDLGKQGYEVTILPVDEYGMVNPDDVKEALKDNTILIAVMHANNEIGTIQPIKEIGSIARERNVSFLVDACQTIGHIPVNVNDLNADLLSLSAHKFNGPKGIGALYVRDGLKIKSFLRGGGQERGRRASTQNVASIVGLAKAIQICESSMSKEQKEHSKLRDRLIEEIPKIIEGTKVNGHPQDRLPNNAHFSFEGVEGESLLMSLDIAGIACSMGSACTTGAMEPSHVLKAIGVADELAYGSLRLTVGRWTKEDHIDTLLEKLPSMITSLNV